MSGPFDRGEALARAAIMELRHPGGVTWTGWWIALGYRIRGWCIAPAREDKRCIMGYPVRPAVRCPRESLPGGLWCIHHAQEQP